MASYFFDSSAIVKRYAAEVGSSWVMNLTDPVSGHTIYVVRVTGAEVASALVRKRPPLLPADLVRALADFKRDFLHQYQRLAANDVVVIRAMTLAETHHLRGYDAVQLAAALELLAVNLAAGLPSPIFVSADVHLNTAAVAEGLTVDNPNSHP